MTGKNPGKHGLYDWIYRQQDSYDVSPVTAQHGREPALWQILGSAGRRVCTVNVPMTYPPRPVNGFMISGLPAPSTRVTVTYPATLLAEIEEQVGPYLLYPDPGQAYSDSGVDAFLERLYRTTETRLKVMDYLRSREDWDFFMLVFSGTDTVQHAMWKYMAPDHPLHDPRKRAKYGDAILRYYQFVDRSLGEVVAGLDRDTVLVLMSDHGFGPFHKFIHVNNWLRDQGWLQLRRTLKAQAKLALFRLGFTPMTIYNLLMQIGLGSLKREVERGQGEGLFRTLFLSFDDVDWPRTAAYSLGNVGQIFVNLRGREPQGMVEPGAEYESVRDEIIARLWELRDPATGERVVEQVYRREEIYSGDRIEQAADILFIPTRMEYFGFGECEFGFNKVIEPMKRGISGTHRLNGMFLLWGQPVREGTWLEGVQITDLAPTLLQLAGVRAPGDMDGRVLGEALKPEYVEAPPDELALDSHAVDDLDGFELSAEDEALIKQRLQGLGYVG
jgi:predicted AlkP superfamily phosphohydrolase/phosphomutase